MKRVARWVAVTVVVIMAVGAVVVGSFALWAAGGPAALMARPLPAEGEPEIGVDYLASVDCLHQFRAGDVVWRIQTGDGWPPPEAMPGIREAIQPWSVPGIVRFSSSATAVFRAQTDGSEWAVAPASGQLAGGICI